MILYIILVAYAALWVARYSYIKLTGREVLFNQLSACGLIPMGGSADECGDSSGGVVRVYIADMADIDLDNATVSTAVGNEGQLITLPYIGGSTPYVELVPDANDQASFNQEGSRSDTGRFSSTQTGNLTFSNITPAKYRATRALLKCCELVAVYEWANGLVTVQGIAQNKDTATVRKSIKPLRAIPSINSNTTGLDDDSQVALQLVNTDSNFAMTLFAGSVSPAVPATTLDDIVG